LRPRPAAALQTERQTGEEGGRGDEALKHKQVSADRPIAPHQEGQPAKGRPKSRKELPIVYYAYADERRRGILTAPGAPPSVKVVLPRQHLDVLLEFVDRKGNPIEPGSPRILCKHAHVAVRARESGRAALRVVLGKMRRKAKLELKGKRRVGALRLLEDAAEHDPKLGGRRLKFRLLPAPESQR